METDRLKTGTTTVGIVAKDCVILAADKRATAGNLIVDKNVTKVVKINDRIAVTTAGTVSEIQLLVKYLRAELKLKEIRTNRNTTVSEAANLMAGMVYSAIRNFSTIPGIAHFLLGGTDGKSHLYDIFPDGSITKIDTFVSSGSGSVFAYGVMEANYKQNLSEDQAVSLALQSVNAAMQRDAMSGQGIDVFVIDKNGVRSAVQKMVTTSVTK